jgi:hypothetical protein
MWKLGCESNFVPADRYVDCFAHYDPGWYERNPDVDVDQRRLRLDQ